MTNIEKVKRILDAGHWVNIIDEDFGNIIVTSYHKDYFSCIDSEGTLCTRDTSFIDCTIEVIQRIPTPYKAGDKVLVLSNPSPENKHKEAMVGKICEICDSNGYGYDVWCEDKSSSWFLISHCLAPVFDDEPNLSGKEVTIVIDGKEYTAVMK